MQNMHTQACTRTRMDAHLHEHAHTHTNCPRARHALEHPAQALLASKPHHGAGSAANRSAAEALWQQRHTERLSMEAATQYESLSTS